METRYFDSNGKELFLGTTLVNVEDAAYATNNPNDLVFRRIPSNRELRIVDGAPVWLDKVSSRADLISFNRQRRNERIRDGISVTAMYLINDELKTAHTEQVRITDRLRSDVLAIAFAFANCGQTDPEPLEIAANRYLLINSEEDAKKLFMAGKNYITGCYQKEREGKAIIAAASDSELAQVKRDLLLHWSQFSVSETLT